jgi:hypothetical protein
MCKRFSLPPVFQVQSSLLKAPTTNLTGPVATPAPLRRDSMSFATSVDKVVLEHDACSTSTLPADTPASRIYQDRDQLANARVAEADAPSHHYNRGKPRKLLGIQQGKGGAELPLPARRRQAPRWARGWVGDPRARSRTPPTSAPFAKKVGSKT